ncbi:MAG TPA: transposase, partial [Verrucomicrobiae bacterium]|nr:transposase [Verrucomicrobiae bacterium]
MIIYKAYQFKFEATPAQEQQFWQYCGAVRWVYNHMLAQRKVALAAGERVPTTNEQIKQLPILKRQTETAWLREPHSQVLQDAVGNLDAAFERFFNKESRFPRFKQKHGSRQSFSYPQNVQVNDNKVFLPKIGWVRLRRSLKRKRYR